MTKVQLQGLLYTCKYSYDVDARPPVEVLLETEDSRLEIISDMDNVLEDIKSKVADI